MLREEMIRVTFTFVASVIQQQQQQNYEVIRRAETEKWYIKSNKLGVTFM